MDEDESSKVYTKLGWMGGRWGQALLNIGGPTELKILSSGEVCAFGRVKGELGI